MTKWREARISSLCKATTSGGTPSRKRPDFYCEPPDGTPWVKSQELRDRDITSASEHITDEGLRRSSAKVIPSGSVVVAMYGATVGRLGYLDIPAAVNQAICALIADPTVADSRFLYYALMNARSHLISQAQGAAQQNLSQERIRSFTLSVPDVSTQRRVSTVLTAFDQLIENNLRRIAVLEEAARSIYAEWFARYRFPGRDSEKDSEPSTERYPSDWTERPLGEMVRLIRGRSYRKTELVDSGGVAFINLKCVERGGGFRRSGLKRYTGAFHEEQRALAGDIVLAVTDLTQARDVIARPALVPVMQEGFGVISLDLVRLIPRNPADRLFLYWHMLESRTPHELKEKANGATVLHLAPTAIEETRILTPPGELRAQFAKTISPLIELASELSEQERVVASARDLLLPKLVSGALDVDSLGIDDAFGWADFIYDASRS